MKVELRYGDYRAVMRDVYCDTLLPDPPYGERTHEGHNAGRPQIAAVTGQGTATSIHYDAWTPEDVFEFVSFWATRTRGWMCCFTSDDLIDAYRDAFRRHGLYSFAPVIVIQKVPRLLGDGPSSWARYLMTARPRSRAFVSERWGCLPGMYLAKTERGAPIAGCKPVDLMKQIVEHYSRPGDTVCDPCAGWGSTLIAAATTGRVAIGSEVTQSTYDACAERLKSLG